MSQSRRAWMKTAAMGMGGMLAAERATAAAPLNSSRALADPRDEFVHQCVPHMTGRWAHPETVCGCLHDYAVAGVQDNDLREAVLRGIDNGLSARSDGTQVSPPV